MTPESIDVSAMERTSVFTDFMLPVKFDSLQELVLANILILWRAMGLLRASQFA
jgi:hypothetical protein